MLRSAVVPLLSFALAVTPLQAGAQAVASPGDPLTDPGWRNAVRGHRAATWSFAALTAASLGAHLGVTYAHPHDHCEGDCKFTMPTTRRDNVFDEAVIATGVVFGVAMLGLVIAGSLYDRHLDRAIRYRPDWRLPDLTDRRADTKWYARDRRLTHGMRASAALAGIGGAGAAIGWQLIGDGPGGIGLSIAATAIGALGLGAFAALAGVRRGHRRQLDRWPHFTGTGLRVAF